MRAVVRVPFNDGERVSLLVSPTHAPYDTFGLAYHDEGRQLAILFMPKDVAVTIATAMLEWAASTGEDEGE
jgi:hypothetical protein